MPCWSHIPHCWKSHALAQLYDRIYVLITSQIIWMDLGYLGLGHKSYICGNLCRVSCQIKENQNKKEGNGQELIQLNTTPDPGHHMGK